MELFKENKAIRDWGTVYLGLKKEWLTPKEVISFCEAGRIDCSEERLVQMHIAIYESLFQFLELIKEFVFQDTGYSIEIMEDSFHPDLMKIPNEHWLFWEAEMLLRIMNSSKDKELKLEKVGMLHSEFNYPSSWLPFLPNMPAPDNNPVGMDAVYDAFERYVKKIVALI